MFEYFLDGIILTFATLHASKNTYKEKINQSSAKILIVFVLFAFLIGINYQYSTSFMKFILSVLLMLVFNYTIFKKEIKETIASVIAVEIIIIASELLFGISVLAISQITNTDTIMDKYFGALITNVTISIMVIFMTLANLPHKIYKKIVTKIKNVYKKQLIPIMIFLIVSINILFFSIYYEMPLILLIVINSVIMAIYGYIILKITNEKNENLKIFEKYKKTADSLNEYQDAVNKYRVNSHENQNQLQTIERMAIAGGNKDIEKYIKALLDKNDQTKMKLKMDKIVIPDGWLKTTLYTKLETIVKNNIKYILDIDRTVKTSDLIEIDEYTMLDICNILNIFLDNAIEAVLNNPTGKIKIRFYKEQNMIIISVSNPIYKELNIKKIDEKGYTSKGEGRGYGLAFVKETVRNNKKIINEKRISNGIFIQFLKIKI